MSTIFDTITAGVRVDPGLTDQDSTAAIARGAKASEQMNALLMQVNSLTGVNDDSMLDAADMGLISQAIAADPAAYADFLEGQGNDENGVSTGIDDVQNDGATLMFNGRKFIDTVADAIYHFGFPIVDGRFENEDGNANELAADVAGWLNYFLNGENLEYGSEARGALYSGDYSDYFAAARNETFLAAGGNNDIWACDGNDKVMSGDGHDKSGGGTGNDRMFGENSDDTLWAMLARTRSVAVRVHDLQCGQRLAIATDHSQRLRQAAPMARRPR